MSKFVNLALLVFLAVVFVTQPIQAQEAGSLNDGSNSAKNIDAKTVNKTVVPASKTSYRLRRGAKEFEITTSFSPMQPTFLSGHKEYDTSGRTFGMINFKIGRTIGTVKKVTYQYFFEVTPLAVAFRNEIKNPDSQNTERSKSKIKTIRRNTYGFGFQPVNFRFIFLPSKRIKPFAQVGAGFIFFPKGMPVPESTGFNFTGDFGGGFHYILNKEKKNKALTFGYRYFHISNMNTTDFNPGYNANVFYLGYSFIR